MRINPYHNFNTLKSAGYKSAYNSAPSSMPNFSGIFKKNNSIPAKETQMPGYEALGVYRYFSPQNSKKSKDEPKAPLLDDNTYLIRMARYKDNRKFAKKMNELTYKISNMISNDEKFSDILDETEKGVKKIRKKERWGKKRIEPDYYELGPYGRGQEYWPTYLKLFDFDSDKPRNFIRPIPNEEYEDANTCLISFRDYPRAGIEIEYGWNGEKSNLKLAKKEYKKLKNIEDPTIDDINRSVATIHWLIAQETPYQRGSDSIANVLTKSIYHSYGVQTSRIKEGKSFDFEAFYRDLDEYIRIYPTLFEEEPKFVQDREKIAM